MYLLYIFNTKKKIKQNTFKRIDVCGEQDD